MNIKFSQIVLLSCLILFSCGSSENAKSKKITHTRLDIKSSKVVFDPASLKFSCDSLLFSTLNSGNKIQKLIIFNGSVAIDTLNLTSKNLSLGIDKEILKADLNFDGFCDFVIPDKKTQKDGGVKHLYFVYDTELHEFIENTTLPVYIGGFKLDIKNQRVKLYCPNEECFAYYKYTIDKKFELVQGEFKTNN